MAKMQIGGAEHLKWLDWGRVVHADLFIPLLLCGVPPLA